MKYLIIFFAISFTTIPVVATEWLTVADYTQIDLDSIEPYRDNNGNILEDKFVYWVKKKNNGSYIFSTLENAYKKKIGYFMDKEVADCKLKKFDIRSNYIYDYNSKLIYRFDNPDYRQDWHSIVPESSEYAVFNEVYKYKLKYDEEQKKKAEEEALKAKQKAEEELNFNNPPQSQQQRNIKR